MDDYHTQADRNSQAALPNSPVPHAKHKARRKGEEDQRPRPTAGGGGERYNEERIPKGKSLGQLVRLGCGVAACTPASYQRHSL